MKINKVKTLERIRGRYPSAAACARAYGISIRNLHFALSGERGHSARRSTAKAVLERLNADGLLAVDDDDPAMMAG
jgi:hypothetical protein